MWQILENRRERSLVQCHREGRAQAVQKHAGHTFCLAVVKVPQSLTAPSQTVVAEIVLLVLDIAVSGLQMEMVVGSEKQLDKPGS
jgi:hypothetical protein